MKIVVVTGKLASGRGYIANNLENDGYLKRVFKNDRKLKDLDTFLELTDLSESISKNTDLVLIVDHKHIDKLFKILAGLRNKFRTLKMVITYINLDIERTIRFAKLNSEIELNIKKYSIGENKGKDPYDITMSLILEEEMNKDISYDDIITKIAPSIFLVEKHKFAKTNVKMMNLKSNEDLMMQISETVNRV